VSVDLFAFKLAIVMFAGDRARGSGGRSGVGSGVGGGVGSGVGSGVRGGRRSGVRSGVRSGRRSGVRSGSRSGVGGGRRSRVGGGHRSGVGGGGSSHGNTGVDSAASVLRPASLRLAPTGAPEAHRESVNFTWTGTRAAVGVSVLLVALAGVGLVAAVFAIVARV